ncbi:MAG: YggT family protein [Propionibacteriaceae bacterium]|jgi:YggT family protein|nr:YggT family protein [Propionibacteriaceae bacterium]
MATLYLIMNLIMGLIAVYEFILFIRVILSWVVAFNQEWTPRGPLLVVSEFVYTLTDPPLRLIRRVIKPVRFGQFALDLSVIVLFIVIFVLSSVISLIFSSLIQ